MVIPPSQHHRDFLRREHNSPWLANKRNEVNTCTPKQWYDSAKINGYCDPRDVPVCSNAAEVYFLEVRVSGVNYFAMCEGTGPTSVCPDPDEMTIDDFTEGSPEDMVTCDRGCSGK